MKYIILLLLASTSVHAQDVCKEIKQDVNTPVPTELKDAKIIVRTKDGKEREVSANEFKVVPRKQQFKVTEREVPCEPVIKEVLVKEEVRHKNILSLTATRSLRDFEVESQPGVTIIRNEYGISPGLMYQRDVYDGWYLGGQFNLNKDLGLSIGKGF